MEGILNKSQCYHLIKCMIVDKYSMPDAFIGVFKMCTSPLSFSEPLCIPKLVTYSNSAVCPYFLLDCKLPKDRNCVLRYHFIPNA